LAGRSSASARLEHDQGTSFLGAVAAAATPIVVIGVTVLLFFNPLFIGFEQDQAGVPAITGYTPEQVRSVTGSILADLIVGPPAFTAAVNGQPVLDAAERSHMVDVRNVLLPLATLFVAATLALIAVAAVNRRSAWAWRAIERGSGALAVAGVLIGVAVLFFFDAAFLLFHLVFFPQGNFSFDPRSQRLTQLFPVQFWSETAIGIALVGITLALGVTLVARRRIARPPD